MVFVSMSFRFRIDVEAANMVESVGNYSRHRVVPIIAQYYDGNGGLRYELTYLPAISGQSLANAFSRALTDIALSTNHPVCDMCRNYEKIGGFPKRPTLSDNDSIDKRVKECIVEDVTGFMATKGGERGEVIKRTSKIWFSYMIPDADSIKHAPPIPQFHVRYSTNENEQMIFSIESGSAIYRVKIAIDIDSIGKLTDNKYVDNRLDRINDVFDALALMFNGYIGAKKARYLPQMEFLGGIASISHPYRFMVTPAKAKLVKDRLESWYLYDTVTRATRFLSIFGNKVRLSIYYADKEFNTLLASKDITIEGADSLEDLISKVRNSVQKLI